LTFLAVLIVVVIFVLVFFVALVAVAVAVAFGSFSTIFICIFVSHLVVAYLSLRKMDSTADQLASKLLSLSL